MDAKRIAEIVADLREEGSDLSNIEVKAAKGGFPQSAKSTLSAFANTPGGGLLIFGLSDPDFTPVKITDPAALQASLASIARTGMSPPITFSSGVVKFEGASLVWAEIDELSTSAKPAHVIANKKAYLRSYDGDYELSDLEKQAFIANRTAPKFDGEAVTAAGIADLDSDLKQNYIETCRASSAQLSKFSDAEILVKTGVLTSDGAHPTLAGLLALGSYPQQYFPNLAIQASVMPGPDEPVGTRAVDPRRFDGPVPVMLEEALRWVQRNTRTRIRFGADGHGRDEPEYPNEAVRELLSNALVHRDLGPYALNQAITIRLEPGKLIIHNAGGLFGISASQLGKIEVTSARNGYLIRICQNVRSGGSRRVVEALATGIKEVLRSVAAAGMVAPRFLDRGIGFTVVMPNHSLLSAEKLAWVTSLPGSTTLNDVQRHALVIMRDGHRWTNSSLRKTFRMDSVEARALMTNLVERGLVISIGEKKGRAYQIAPTFDEVRDDRPALWDDSEIAEPPLSNDSKNKTRTARTSRDQNAALIRQALSTTPKSLQDLATELDLTTRQVTYALELLRASNTVEIVGSQGKRDSTYKLV